MFPSKNQSVDSHSLPCYNITVICILYSCFNSVYISSSVSKKGKGLHPIEHIIAVSTATVNKLNVNMSGLDSTVSDYHIYAIAYDIVDWEVLAPDLDLIESDVKEIKEDFDYAYYFQKKEALYRWKLANQDKATYRALAGICRKHRLIALAERVEKYPGSKEEIRDIQVLNVLKFFLLSCYQNEPHPSIEQWPSKIFGTLFGQHLLHHRFFDLILHEASLNSLAGIKLPDAALKPVTLCSVFSSRQRLLVYFEGIAGSGKTTLSWHTCKEWGEKRMLKQFHLLIHVHLNDPKVQRASRLHDIIPYPDVSTQKQVASAIISLKGKGVCFLLDGLDETLNSPVLFDFLFRKLIPGRVGCPQLSFILTSRPNPRVTRELEAAFKTRIILSGFKGASLHQFLDHTLGANSDERKRLMETIAINPRLEGLCSLPINAVIMSYLMPFIGDAVPTTQTELYHPLFSNFLTRHIEERKKASDPPTIKNLLNDVPHEIQKPFEKVCSLAFSSSQQLKQHFTASEVDDSLGFLEIHQELTMFGRERYYSFAHLSIQEFLAAIHLSQLPMKEQLRALEEILENNPLSQVLSFFAGLTHLLSREAFKLISTPLKQAGESVEILKHSGDPQQKALASLTCLFECKNDSLLMLPETNLSGNKGVHKGIDDLYKQANPQHIDSTPDTLHSLTLHYLPLTPLDCLSLGYYIHAKSIMPTINDSEKIIAFDLNGCSIDHTGLRLLLTELKKGINHRTNVRLQLTLCQNKFDQHSLYLLKDLLQGQSNLETLNLCNCFKPSLVSQALKCVIEGLSKDSSCGFIDLSVNPYNSTHIYYIILMLRASPQLYWLSLHCYDLSRVMQLFSRAIAFTKLQSLEIGWCNISDSGLIELGRSIYMSRFLLNLHIFSNPFTNHGFCVFLKLFVRNPYSVLSFLGLHFELNQDQRNIMDEINQFRRQIRNPPLIDGSYLNVNNFYSQQKSYSQLRQSRLKKDGNR